jgi:hypothetical protein
MSISADDRRRWLEVAEERLKLAVLLESRGFRPKM